MSQKRDANLPDYLKPPINEVVLGVQFLTPPGYGQIYSGDVWNLFRAKYPRHEVQPPLAPAFEVFGKPNHGQFFQSPFRIGSAVQHDRLWFIANDNSELIQFQQDRLMHNWRHIAESNNEYPRFDSLIATFRKELDSLNSYMSHLSSGQSLQINQCEVSYINHLPISDKKSDFWVSLFNFESIIPENLTFTLQEVLSNDSGSPIARLFIEAFSGINTATNEHILSLNLTVRGAPRDASIDASLEFLSNARKIIVNKFTDITTKAAHTAWERQQ